MSLVERVKSCSRYIILPIALAAGISGCVTESKNLYEGNRKGNCYATITRVQIKEPLRMAPVYNIKITCKNKTKEYQAKTMDEACNMLPKPLTTPDPCHYAPEK